MNDRPTNTPLVLLVDDDPIQLKLSQAHLRDAGFKVEVATDTASALAAARARPDVIVSDVLLGDVDGFSLCQSLRSQDASAHIPIVLTSSYFREKEDRTLALSVGANVLVQRTADFGDEIAAIRAVLEAPEERSPDDTAADSHGLYARRVTSQLHRLLGQAHSADERYRALLDNANVTVAILDLEGFILEANQRLASIFKVPQAQIVGRHISQFAAPEQVNANLEGYRRSVNTNNGENLSVALRRADGATIYMQFTNTRIDVNGQSLVLSIGREVTESIEAAKRLEASEAKYRSLLENIPDAVQSSTLDGRIMFVSQRIEQLTGFPVAELVHGGIGGWVSRVHPDDKPNVRAVYETVTTRAKTSFDMEYRWQRKDGTWAWFRDRAVIGKVDGIERVDGVVSDTSDHKALEAQMRQAQRLEAIGQLTGGVAHDFNNILSVILLNSQFLAESLGETSLLLADVAEITTAAERAAALTRQLLAFSRDLEILQPKRIDLNEVTGGLMKMLRRLIGENIELAVVSGSKLDTVVADPAQIEQVLMNLVVNARDAMPNGGRLSISTANVELDDTYAASHGPVVAGKYVMLSVSDTGCGMDEETRRRAFDPFFTTKEVGKGTGLGLATCYGIVKQSGGFIWLYSEVGHGTTFKVYLPASSGGEDHPVPAVIESDSCGGETILVIEDEEQVRNVVRRILSSRGYRVLLAHDGAEALRIRANGSESIDLVLSDVIMPHQSGPEIVRQLANGSHTLRSLFMSGYTDNEVLTNGLLQPGTNFIQKPFAAEVLARKVREVLDA